MEAPWQLFVPPGPSPAGGWPLVVGLHGWGMTGESFARRCRPLLFPGAAFLFPEGPYSFELRHQGKIRIGHAWYLFNGDDEPFRSTLGQTQAHLLDLIDSVAVRAGLDPDHVHLVGFSQGAYAGYFMALGRSRRFAGMVAIGGGRLREEFVTEGLTDGRRIPFLLIHGRNDASVPMERTLLMKELLERHGFPVELRPTDAGHEITPETLTEAREWLAKRLTST